MNNRHSPIKLWIVTLDDLQSGTGLYSRPTTTATLLPPRYSQMHVSRIDRPNHAITYYNRYQLTATIVTSSGKA